MGGRPAGAYMSINSPEIDLDAHERAIPPEEVLEFEKRGVPLVTLNSSADHWDKIRQVLCELRSANISAVLLLKQEDEVMEDEEITAILGFLKDWDQCLMVNLLELCSHCIPAVFLPHLQVEAKNELKWFREWLTAMGDTRIHRYPGLPWRSFVRKIVKENYEFGMQLLTLVSLPATTENIQRVQTHFNAFLENKRKVVCVFPKNWGRTQ